MPGGIRFIVIQIADSAKRDLTISKRTAGNGFSFRPKLATLRQIRFPGKTESTPLLYDFQ